MHDVYGIDVSDEAIRKSVAEHNRVCELIRAIGEYRKGPNPRITGYEFHVITLATYVRRNISSSTSSKKRSRSSKPADRIRKIRTARAWWSSALRSMISTSSSWWRRPALTSAQIGSAMVRSRAAIRSC